MSQTTDEPVDPDLAQIVEQLDRIEVTLDGVAETLADLDDGQDSATRP